jgi:hypothetical protein
MIYDRWIRNWKGALAENFFLRSVTLLLGVSLVVATLMLSVKTQRILLVPPQITKEFRVERDRVAPEYMEQMGVFIATLVGNLSPGNAEFNVNMLIKHYLDPGRKHPEAVRELLGQAALSVHQSGKFIGMSKLSKRGNCHLRRAIYLLTASVVSQSGFFKAYFLKRKREGVALQKAIFAAAHKLIRVIFAMLCKNI